MAHNYIDAHSHLHFKEIESADLSDYWTKIFKVAVNGTSPLDWEKVAQLYEKYPDKVMPSFGVHPWEVNSLHGEWKESLIAHLERFPTAGVGEIGLDKWVRGYDLLKQKEVFLYQLGLANDYGRAITIHCLKAWGTLKTLLESYDGKPFLLHAYGGPKEILPYFLERGAYFSFSPYFFHPRKERAREVFKFIPMDRILLETDSPSMLGPKVTWSDAQRSFNGTHQHPANIFKLYEEVATFLEVDEKELLLRVESNAEKLFF